MERISHLNGCINSGKIHTIYQVFCIQHTVENGGKMSKIACNYTRYGVYCYVYRYFVNTIFLC